MGRVFSLTAFSVVSTYFIVSWYNVCLSSLLVEAARPNSEYNSSKGPCSGNEMGLLGRI